MCLRTSSKDILSLCDSLKLTQNSGLVAHDKVALTRNTLRQTFPPEPVTTQTPPTSNMYRIKMPKRPNAKKMDFKEYLMEKYRKAKIRETQKLGQKIRCPRFVKRVFTVS